MDHPLEVDIVDDHLVRVSRVHWGCTLELYREKYPIYLVPIPLRENKVIVWMDWLTPNGEMIDCGLQLVYVRTPSGGELVIHGDGAQREATLCSVSRDRHYL